MHATVITTRSFLSTLSSQCQKILEIWNEKCKSFRICIVVITHFIRVWCWEFMTCSQIESYYHMYIMSLHFGHHCTRNFFCNFSRFSLTNSEHKSLCNKTALLLTKRRIYRRKKALVTEKYVTWVHELQAHKRAEWINKCGKYEEKKYCIKGIEWHYIYLCVCWVSFSRGWCFFYLGLVHKFWRIFSLQKTIWYFLK